MSYMGTKILVTGADGNRYCAALLNCYALPKSKPGSPTNGP